MPAFADMTLDELRAAVDAMSAEVSRREAVEELRAAVDAAVEAYASECGLTVLQAWRKLAPEGVEVPDDPEPEPVPDAPEYIAPTGAHDAYSIGDLVTFKSRVYRSRIDGNTWSPAAYPQGWEEIA